MNRISIICFFITLKVYFYILKNKTFEKLERKLTLPAVIAISIGGMLGTGIFVLPGVAAGMIGEYLWLAYIFSGLFILPSVLSKSELATAMPQSGGTYVI